MQENNTERKEDLQAGQESRKGRGVKGTNHIQMAGSTMGRMREKG